MNLLIQSSPLQSTVLQMVYDSEINFELSCFWDAGFYWKLGDSANGYVAEGKASSIEDPIRQLTDAALTHLPESGF
jgi:hypothetical protein